MEMIGGASEGSMAEGGSEASIPVHVRTLFERFPASIRGAFVFRGADGNPHAVRIVTAGLGRVPTGPVKPVPVEDRLMDVAPARDLFVPYEVPISDLEPAWYAVHSSIQVDAGRTFEFVGRPFTIPWPRSDVRRGSIVVGESIAVGGHGYLVERVDLTADCAVVSWRAGRGESGTEEAGTIGEPVGQGEAVLLADGRTLEPLPIEAGGRTAAQRSPGEARTVTYPVPRSCHSLAVAIASPSGRRSKPLELRLP